MRSRLIQFFGLTTVGTTLLVLTLINGPLNKMGGAWLVGAMFLLAYAKGVLVILDSMDLSQAPPVWRVLLWGWAVTTTLAVLLGWWLGMRA